MCLLHCEVENEELRLRGLHVAPELGVAFG